jgi:hypothetical protein
MPLWAKQKKSGPEQGPPFLSGRQRLPNDNTSAGGADADAGAVMIMPVFANDNVVTVMVTPAEVTAVVTVVLLDDDRFRTGGIAYHRQSDAEGGKGRERQ